MKIALALLALSLAAQAQTAKVIELSPDEAKEAVKLDQQRKALDLEEQNFRYNLAIHHKIAIEYPTTASFCIVPKGALSCDAGPAPKPDHRAVEYKNDWSNGFEYSEDYRFIVPAKTPSAPTNCYASMLTNCSFTSPFYTTTPAWGTTLANPVSGPVADSIVHGYTY